MVDETLSTESLASSSTLTASVEDTDKVFLSKYNKPWDVINDKWIRTFPTRRDELFSKKSIKDFLSDWPLLGNASYAPLLVSHLNFILWFSLKTKCSIREADKPLRIFKDFLIFKKI